MQATLDSSTSTKSKSSVPWRLHRDYPTPLPTRLLDTDNNTDQLLSGVPEAVELSVEVSHSIAEAILRNVGLRELCAAFTQLVDQIPEVQMVLLQQNGDSGHILTLIDAPPFERQARNRVYAAQQTVFETLVSRPVEFRVINSREIQVAISEIVPSDAAVLYAKR